VNSNRRVVHITSVHPALDTRIFVKECSTLARANWEVKLLVLGAESITRNGVEIIGVPFSGGRIKRFIRGGRLLIERALELNAAVYHIHDPELLFLANQLIRKGKKVIYDAHEDLPRQVAHKHYIPGWLKGIASRCVEWLEDHYASRMSAIVSVTPTIVERFGKIHSNVVEVCNYPDFDDIAIDRQRSSSRNICYVGGVTEARGIRELLDALVYTDAKLILAGACSPSELLEELKTHRAWSKVDYRGFLDRDGVNQVMRESMVGLVTLRPHPGYSTAYPVKMFEYMAAGLPVLATNIPLWKAILEEAGAGYTVDINQSQVYGQCIDAFLNDPQASLKMGLAGRQAAELRFNWANESKKLLDLYNRLTQ
jgi:glycosyltransferase involved in cell wall biosynthesis